MINEIIGHNVAFYRKQQGLEQTDLAEKLMLSQAVVSRLESGKAQWTVARMMRVCLILSIDSVEFLEKSIHLTK
jgi:transcriptional regulator with XRE-family HTH domain